MLHTCSIQQCRMQRACAFGRCLSAWRACKQSGLCFRRGTKKFKCQEHKWTAVTAECLGTIMPLSGYKELSVGSVIAWLDMCLSYQLDTNSFAWCCIACVRLSLHVILWCDSLASPGKQNSTCAHAPTRTKQMQGSTETAEPPSTAHWTSTLYRTMCT